MRLIIASNNAHKICEIKQILGCRFNSVISMADAGIDMDIIEDGLTFIDNARIKANAVFDAAIHTMREGDAVLADDSGLLVKYLGDAPGVHSARYAGSAHDDTANRAKLLRELIGVPTEMRTAHFVTAMVLKRKGCPNIESIGKVEGRILESEIGENGFGYDSLFYYEPFKMSFAQLDSEQKNSVSHRRNALMLVLAALNTESPCE